MAFDDEFEDESGIDPELNHLTHEIIGAAIEVHRILGPGFLEEVYEGAMALEMSLRNIAFERQAEIFVLYKNKPVGKGRLDFRVGGRVIVELKAVDALAPIHTAQLISYLKTTNIKLGLLLNFNVRVMKDGIKRIAK